MADNETAAVAPLLSAIAAFQADTLANPAALQNANLLLLSTISDLDATTILAAYASLIELNRTGRSAAWQPPPAFFSTLSHLSATPYLQDVAAAPAPSGPAPAVVTFPFTPACAPPSCVFQTLAALSASIAGDLALNDAFKELLAPTVAAAATQCLANPGCTVADLSAVAAELTLTAPAPELALVFKTTSFAKLAYDLTAYETSNLNGCDTLQDSVSCCTTPLTSCGTICCQASESCASAGQCVPCTPNCSGKQCGDNGCGGTCGTCAAGQSCGTTAQCTDARLAKCQSTCFDAELGCGQTSIPNVCSQVIGHNSCVLFGMNYACLTTSFGAGQQCNCPRSGRW